MKIKKTAVIVTVLVAGLMIASINGSTQSIIGFFIAAVTVMIVLLFFGYSLFTHLITAPWIRIKRSLLTHILLHVVPITYLVVQFFIGATLIINTVYLLPFILFFYTGRRTWDGMFNQFGTKMYRVYYFGNTAFMRLCPILLAAGFLVDEPLGTEGFRRAVVGYFSIHFLITGLTMVTIEKDILGQKCTPNRQVKAG